jgi:hypothetical protein
MRFRGARAVIATLAAASAIGLTGGAVHADEGWVMTSEIAIGTDSALTAQDVQVDGGGGSW